jgi:ABC-type uncharacterized transport system substrate-binding protein
LGLLSLKRATHSIPIVFTTLYDPVGSGYVASLLLATADEVIE